MKNTRLIRLLASFAVLNAAEWSFITALSVHAFRVGGTLAVGLIGLRLLAGAVSSVVLAPLVERRRGVLQVITALRGLLLGAAAVLVLRGVALAPVLALVAVDSVVVAPYRPAQSWLLPALARSPAELTHTAAGISVARTLGQITGAFGGGLAIDHASAGATMTGSAALMLVGAVMASGRHVQAAGGSGRSPASPISALRSGLAAFPVVFGDRLTWPLVVATGLRSMLRGLWTALVVVVALRLLDLGGPGVGILQGAAAAGAVLGLPLSATEIGRTRLSLPCMVSFALAGITVSLVGVTAVTAVAIALIVAWGMAMAVADLTSLALLHRLIHGGALSRTVGVMQSLSLLNEGIGALLVPALVALFGLRLALVIAGLPLPVLIVMTGPRLRQADERAAGRGRLVALLHGVGLLHRLDMAQVEDLAARAEPMSVRAGVDVITQGEVGDRFYVIGAGAAEVLVDGYDIGRLGAGQAFGERALLRDSRRAATVRAVTPLSLYTIDREDFLESVTGAIGGDRHPLADAGDAAGRAQRLQSSVPVPGPTATDPLALRRLLSELTPLSGADGPALTRLVSAARPERRATGDVVVRQGDPSDALYVVIAGRAQISVDDRIIGEVVAGDTFGEIGVLHRTARRATVTATEDLSLLSIPAVEVRAAVGR